MEIMKNVRDVEILTIINIVLFDTSLRLVYMIHEIVNCVLRMETHMTDISIGDRVVCVISGVVGTVTKKYRPTASEPQIMVRTNDGRFYHAPEKEWRKQYEFQLDDNYISELEKHWACRLFPDL